MPTKAQIYAQKADETARQITGDYLDTATKRHRLRQL